LAFRPSGIRAALGALPSKPGVYIALAMIVVVMALYYHRTYKTCTAHKVARAQLIEAAEQAAANPGTIVTLAEVLPFAWTHARTINDLELHGRDTDCPFGWDISAEQRAEMAARENLTVMVFSIGTRFVDYLDLPRNVIDFAQTPATFARDTAAFTVSSNAGGQPPFVLHLTESR